MIGFTGYYRISGAYLTENFANLPANDFDHILWKLISTLVMHISHYAPRHHAANVAGHPSVNPIMNLIYRYHRPLDQLASLDINQ